MASKHEFGKLLVEFVRDEAIRAGDRDLSLEGNGPGVERWREMRDKDPEEFLKMVIMDTVDETIARMLLAIDSEEIDISFKSKDGSIVHLGGDGELCGWYMGSEGWRAQFTKERYIDDYSDL